MFKLRNDMLPNVIFNEMFSCNVNIYQYNTRQRSKMYVPKRRLAIALKHISYQGVLLWNSVLDKLEINCSIVTFKRNMIKYLLYNDL